MEKALDLLGIKTYDVVVDKNNVYLDDTSMSRRSFLIMTRKKKKKYKNKIVVFLFIQDEYIFENILKPHKSVTVKLEKSFPYHANVILPVYQLHGEKMYMYSSCDENVDCKFLKPIFTY